jgi:serine/threonine protein kinase
MSEIPQSTPGQFIGRYRCLAYLGSGGMADVFRCELQGIGGFGKICVVKRMKPELAADAEHVAMFLDEARLVARLQHPNVVQVFEVDSANNVPFIAMELVRGPTLSQLLRTARKRGDVRDALIVRIISDAALGLAAAHSALDDNGVPLNIVHRDVSPQNVMIGNGGVTKILDFGIAKAEGKLGKTQTGLLKGKIAYMAPEQIALKDVDLRADVFSLGICLYQSLVGKLPFSGKNDFEILRNRMAGEFIDAGAARPDLQASLVGILRHALAEDPAQRYSSALELHEELETYLLDCGPEGDRRTLGTYVNQLFPDLDALFVGRPVDTLSVTNPPQPVTGTMTPISGVTGAGAGGSGNTNPGLVTNTNSGAVVRDPTAETREAASAAAALAPPTPPAPKRSPVVIGLAAAAASGLLVFAGMQLSSSKNKSDDASASTTTTTTTPTPTPEPTPPPTPTPTPVETAPADTAPAPDAEPELRLDDVVAEVTKKPKSPSRPAPKKAPLLAKATPAPTPANTNATPTPPPTTPPPEPIVEPPPEPEPPPPPPKVTQAEPPKPTTTTTTTSTSTTSSPPPAPAPTPPEPPQLPAKQRVYQVGELVALCGKIEAQLKSRGHFGASAVDNVTAPFARDLAKRLVDGDAVDVAPAAIYWFVAGELSRGAKKSSAAQSLVAAQQAGKLK